MKKLSIFTAFAMMFALLTPSFTNEASGSPGDEEITQTEDVTTETTTTPEVVGEESTEQTTTATQGDGDAD